MKKYWKYIEHITLYLIIVAAIPPSTGKSERGKNLKAVSQNQYKVNGKHVHFIIYYRYFC